MSLLRTLCRNDYNISNNRKPTVGREGFYLNKWFLDFISEEGDAMIFYVAILKWRGWKVNYTSWLNYSHETGVTNRSRFSKIHLPKSKDNAIHWNDPQFGVEGIWEAQASPLKARVFESDEGYLDWNCFQPVSKVRLKIKDNIFNGSGYAEQLILTVVPWKIPMNELRWGRFTSPQHQMVWIELRTERKQQLLWINGEKIENTNIEDDHINISPKTLRLELDRSVVLESEKKIFKVARKLIPYLPGFNNSVPLQFLMADEYKWLSYGVLHKDGIAVGKGRAIHELVNFKAGSE